MGGCLARSSFTVNKQTTNFDKIRTQPIIFSVVDAEFVLKDVDVGTYLLYKDFHTEKIYLSLRAHNRIRHHRVLEVDKLFYLDKQPYPYLDSIIFYHRKHKLRGIKLKQRAHLSARVVKAFTVRVTETNGNYLAPPPSSLGHVSWHGSTDSLITSSSAAS